MVMEEENMCCSLLDITDSVLQQPQQDPWTSVDHQCINGEEQANAWDKAELQLNHAQESGQLIVPPHEERGTPEEAEPWEQIIWLVHPMTCASPPLSFATVQWDVPDPTPEASSLVTDSSVATELGSDGMTIVEPTSPSLHQFQDLNDELFMREVREEGDVSDSQLLNSDLQEAGSDFEPCDAADAQDPTAQEGEESTLELLHPNNGIPRTDLEVEDEHSSTSDPVETLDFIDIVKEIEGSEDEADSFVDLKLEEEQEEPGHLLTAQGDSEEEQTSPTVVETEEENEEGDDLEEEKSVTDLSWREESEEAESVHCLSNVEVLAEPLQSENSGLRINEDELIDLKPSESLEESRHSESEEDSEILELLHADPTGRSEESEMCKNQNQNPKEPQAMQDNVELLIEAAHNGETTEDSHLAEESTQPENADLPEECTLSEQTICVVAKHPGVAEKQEQTEPSEQKEPTTGLSQTTLSEQLGPPEETDESKIMEQLSAETEATEQSAETEVSQVDRQAETSHQAEEVGGNAGGSVQTLVANGTQPKALETAVPYMNGCEVDRELARRLAEQLFKLDGIQPVDVVKHLDKDNDFSRAVGEEYLKCFDFTGQPLDDALRSFLKVVVLIGETQERERVLQHFACRFHQCNPDSFSSSGAVLALTCALMLLNTDLHGQNVGKSMSCSKFVSNLDGMNEGENFSKDLLKGLYNSIKSEPLEWAIDEGELMGSVIVGEDAADVVQLRSKANPFQDVPHDKKASEVKEGLLQRKLHADVDGKRTPWGKRGWKTFNGVLRGMVLYLQKIDYRTDQPVNEEVVSVHHSLAEQAADYTKKPHVFRLQTADWRVFLFQASCKMEMHSWISRINLVSALHSSPPFPAAVGSQRRFFRPILPALQSAHSLEHQLQSHSGMLESFKADLSYLQKNLPEGKKVKAKELVEHRIRAEYLHHEMCRYEIYTQALETWKSVKNTDDDMLSIADLNLFDKAMFADTEENEEEEGLKKSHSSPALELLGPPPTVIKVRRNISERRTYRRTIIPRFHKEA